MDGAVHSALVEGKSSFMFAIKLYSPSNSSNFPSFSFSLSSSFSYPEI